MQLLLYTGKQTEKQSLLVKRKKKKLGQRQSGNRTGRSDPAAQGSHRRKSVSFGAIDTLYSDDGQPDGAGVQSSGCSDGKARSTAQTAPRQGRH
jgi:hypothetical protein